MRAGKRGLTVFPIVDVQSTRDKSRTFKSRTRDKSRTFSSRTPISRFFIFRDFADFVDFVSICE